MGRQEGWLRHPSAALGAIVVLLLDLHKSRLQQREATLDSGRASTYHQHSQRLIHAFIIN